MCGADCKRDLSASTQVEALLEQSQLALNQYMLQTRPSSPAKFGMTLLVLPVLRAVPQACLQELFLQRTLSTFPLTHFLSSV